MLQGASCSLARVAQALTSHDGARASAIAIRQSSVDLVLAVRVPNAIAVVVVVVVAASAAAAAAAAVAVAFLLSTFSFLPFEFCASGPTCLLVKVSGHLSFNAAAVFQGH